MAGQRQVQRNATARGLRIHPGTAGKLVHPHAAGREIFPVIALPSVQKVHVQAGILEVVHGAFHIGGETGERAFALHLAHAAAKAHGVCTDHTAGAAVAAQAHIAFGAFVEGEGAQVHPCAATHLLVHVQEGGAAQVMDRIACVVGAVEQGGVAYVDGVLAFFRNVRAPEGLGLVLSRTGGGNHAGRAHLEGIVGAGVALFGIGKTGADGLPFTLFFILALQTHFGVPAGRKARVVVADHFPALGIALARGEHHRAGVLQHGNQEGEYVALRIKVFHGGVGGAPLPFPALCAFFPIASMALPEGDVAAAQAHRPILVPLD